MPQGQQQQLSVLESKKVKRVNRIPEITHVGESATAANTTSFGLSSMEPEVVMCAERQVLASAQSPVMIASASEFCFILHMAHTLH